MITLRPYQDTCIRTIDLHGSGRYLCQLATGLGKTVIFTNMQRYGRTLVLAHREELVTQPMKYFNCGVGLEMAKHKSNGREEVVCASVQSLARRLNRFDRDEFHTIIVDEAHHAAASTYMKIFDHFKPERIIGFTATPNRADGVGLEAVFDNIIFEYSLQDGIKDGWLSPIKCKRVEIGYDLSAVHSRMGDYALNELEEAVNIEGANKAIAEVVKKEAQFPVLIFAVTVNHAESIAAGIPGAVAVSAKSKDRGEVVEAYKAGNIPVLVNCALFTEGTDMPNTRTVLIARPTKSTGLYTQMVGRGTRLHPGKDHCLLIDCVGASEENNMCTAPSLLGLDLKTVPQSSLADIEGDLLAELPALIEKKSDCPETWIKNSYFVNLWAKETKYQLHDINWIKMPDGSFKVSLPERKWIKITPADLTGKAQVQTNGGTCTELMKLQRCFDTAYKWLREHFDDCTPLWRMSSIKRWGKKDASPKQVDFVTRLAMRKRIPLRQDLLDNLTSHEAGNLIERLKVL